MTPATAWRCCAAAGVVVFLCSWGFGQIPGLTPCGPSGGLGPILAFEFVRTPADVAALFGAEPCRSTFAGAQRIGLLLDALGFVPAYTAFLILAVLASARAIAEERAVWKIVVAGLLVAGLADEVEGALLYRIATNLPGNQTVIDALWWLVHMKFALLALGTFGIGVRIYTPRRIASMFVGVAIGTSALRAVHGLLTDVPAMMSAFTIAWVTILLVALVSSIRPSLFSARAAPPPAPAPPTA